jgi:hypothetical protein
MCPRSGEGTLWIKAEVSRSSGALDLPPPPKRVEVGLAVFEEEEPSDEWREFLEQQDEVHHTDTPGLEAWA